VRIYVCIILVAGEVLLLIVAREIMIWVLYDTDLERASEMSSFLMSRFGIEAFPYQEVGNFLESSNTAAIFLVHCDALKSEFNKLAYIRLSGEHSLRFYCTDLRDKTQQVAYVPEEVEKLVS
jgi:hypothetical protein